LGRVCLCAFCTSWSLFSSRRRHTRSKRDWSSDVCSSDLIDPLALLKIICLVPFPSLRSVSHHLQLHQAVALIYLPMLSKNEKELQHTQYHAPSLQLQQRKYIE